jgi:hypothetical protein
LFQPWFPAMAGTSLDVTSAQYTGGRPRPGIVDEQKG